MFFASAGAILVVSGWLLLRPAGAGWAPPRLPFVAEAEPTDRVLVLLVGNEGAVTGMRRAVDAQRVLFASPRAVALAEGRILAVDHDAAGEALNAAGWADRALEILDPGTLARAPGVQSRRPQRSWDTPADRRSRAPSSKVRELASKPTLTPAEAMTLLHELEAGL